MTVSRRSTDSLWRTSWGRIVDATADDTVLNELYDYDWPNSPHRTLRNKMYAEWQAAGCPPRGAKPGEGASIGHPSNTIG